MHKQISAGAQRIAYAFQLPSSPDEYGIWRGQRKVGLVLQATPQAPSEPIDDRCFQLSEFFRRKTMVRIMLVMACRANPKKIVMMVASGIRPRIDVRRLHGDT